MTSVEFFTHLEHEFSQAIQRRDHKTLDERFLDRNYALRISDDPARKISRKDWLATLNVYFVKNWEIRDLELRDFGNVAITSLVLFQQAEVGGVDRSGDFFLTDVWVQNTPDASRLDAANWKIAARYSSPARQLSKPVMSKG
ncbi:MAG TPA: hypothetical protein VGJ30_15940 [Candidatus Angelobacter sp.]